MTQEIFDTPIPSKHISLSHSVTKNWSNKDKKGRKSILSFAKLWASLRDGLVESCSGFRLLSLEGRIKNGCNSKKL